MAISHTALLLVVSLGAQWDSPPPQCARMQRRRCAALSEAGDVPPEDEEGHPPCAAACCPYLSCLLLPASPSVPLPQCAPPSLPPSLPPSVLCCLRCCPCAVCLTCCAILIRPQSPHYPPSPPQLLLLPDQGPIHSSPAEHTADCLSDTHHDHTTQSLKHTTYILRSRSNSSSPNTVAEYTARGARSARSAGVTVWFLVHETAGGVFLRCVRSLASSLSKPQPEGPLAFNPHQGVSPGLPAFLLILSHPLGV